MVTKGSSTVFLCQESTSPGPARFAEPVDALVKRFTASVAFDRRLAEFDIRRRSPTRACSRRSGILARRDLAAIERGLERRSRARSRPGASRWSLDAEDVHLNIERRLTELVGDAGKRLHTARSRNDQVATDLRLWLRAEIDALRALIAGAASARCSTWRERHAALVMPGFTHLQVAQPVTFGHHLLAYFEMLERDRERLADCRKRVNRLPLGAAALAGTELPDRPRARRARARLRRRVRELARRGLATATSRSSSAPARRSSMMHLSRLAEELVLWTNPRFGFVRLPDRFCTGSSIMPQKKNPDVPELVRGKSGRVNGALVALLTLMKGQPLAYNKDNQEDKEPLFDAVDTLKDCAAVFAGLVRGPASRCARRCAPRRSRATRPRPTSPTTWCARACRSATRTRRSRARCARPSSAGVRPRRAAARDVAGLLARRSAPTCNGC